MNASKPATISTDHENSKTASKTKELSFKANQVEEIKSKLENRFVLEEVQKKVEAPKKEKKLLGKKTARKPKEKKSKGENLKDIPSSKSFPKAYARRKLMSSKKSRRIEQYSNSMNIQQKCNYIILRLEETKAFAQFFTPKYELPGKMTLTQIQQRVNSHSYRSLNDVLNDLEAFFHTISEKGLSEDAKRLEEEVIKIRNDIEAYKDRNKESKDVPLSQRRMTEQERSVLATTIRSLPPLQLSGVLKVLFEGEYKEKDGYTEFNLGTLTVEQQRAVEKYVNSCRKTAKDIIPVKYKEGSLVKNKTLSNTVSNNSENPEEVVE